MTEGKPQFESRPFFALSGVGPPGPPFFTSTLCRLPSSMAVFPSKPPSSSESVAPDFSAASLSANRYGLLPALHLPALSGLQLAVLVLMHHFLDFGRAPSTRCSTPSWLPWNPPSSIREGATLLPPCLSALSDRNPGPR